jgi:CBS domain-containing membrane protein
MRTGYFPLARPGRVRTTRALRHGLSGLRAGLGGGVALFVVLWVSTVFVGQEGAALLVASMGASAVLLFSAPKAPLSQPWNVLGGQTASALVGVTCAQSISSSWIAAAVAVGSAIAVMNVLACTHPPGGATALAAVVGGPGVEALGYQYILAPVLLNSCVILLFALFFHFPSRSYPARSSSREPT